MPWDNGLTSGTICFERDPVGKWGFGAWCQLLGGGLLLSTPPSTPKGGLKKGRTEAEGCSPVPHYPKLLSQGKSPKTHPSHFIILEGVKLQVQG